MGNKQMGNKQMGNKQMGWIGKTTYKAKVKAARNVVSVLDKLGTARFPRVVRIESTNHCNADCVTCTRKIMERQTGVMDMELFKKIVDECAGQKVRCIHLHNFGEPFLDKKIFEKIAYVKERGMETRLFTNLSLINRAMAKKVVESGLDRLKVSIDGNSKETYERVRKGLDYDQVMGNLETLLEERKKAGSSTPKVGLVFVDMDENSSEKNDFKKRWEGRVDSINITTYHNWAGSLEGEGDEQLRGLPCMRIWLTFTVLWNGEVSLCCMDYDGSVILGNVRENSIYDIFNGEKLKKIREVHLSGEFDKIPLCDRCDLRR